MYADSKAAMLAENAKKDAGDKSIDAAREAMYDEHFALADHNKDGLLNAKEL